MVQGETYVIVVTGTGPIATFNVGRFLLEMSIDVVRQGQFSALLAFKASVVDPSNFLSTWRNTTGGDNYCAWGPPGSITCSSVGMMVMGLNLRGRGLSGTIPPQLSQLPSLNFLDLSGNYFSGSIPAGLAGPPPGTDKRGVVTLNFDGNRDMRGCVPDDIVNKLNIINGRMFTIRISGTGIGGACGLVPPPLQCPGTLVVANAPSVLTGFPYFYEARNITLIKAPNIIGDPPVITCTPPSSAFFFEGVTPVACLGTDQGGNQATCSFEVNVTTTEESLSTNPPPFILQVVINVDNVRARDFTPAVWGQLFNQLHPRYLRLTDITVWRAEVEDRRAPSRRSLLRSHSAELSIVFGMRTRDQLWAYESYFANEFATPLQTVLSSVLGVPVSLPTIISVQRGGACCLPPSPDPECLLNPEVSSDLCVAMGRERLPSATRDAIWLGDTGLCSECAAVWDRPGARSDPHFVTAAGQHFDWMGEGDRSFCIISDKAVHVNAHLFSGTDGRRTGTWMDQIAVLHGDNNIVVSTGAPTGFPGLHGSVSINGLADVTVGSSSSANFKVVGLNATESVHGVLGQTFRPTSQGAADVSLKGLVEGNDPDYRTSGLLAADCSFSQFSSS
eukprot:jgi/Mesvir1/966/Mv17518-RA.1